MGQASGALKADIDPRVHIALKHEAIDSGETIWSIVEKAIRRELEHRRNLRGGAGR